MLRNRSMVDFSHLSKTTVNQCLRRLSRNELLTREMFADALATIEPPLVTDKAAIVLAAALSPSAPKKRGSPGKGLSPLRLAKEVETIVRADVPARFLAALAGHLRARRPYDDVQRGRSAHRQVKQLKRDMFLRGLYRDLKKKPCGAQKAKISVLGEVKLSCADAGLAPHEQTCDDVAYVMRGHLDLHPPSSRTIMNIVSKS
jgi:hypothetical protein